MNAPRTNSRPSPLDPGYAPVPKPWTARRPTLPLAQRPRPKAILTRRFEILWGNEEAMDDQSLVAPALPLFEQAFSAFSHGVLIQTDTGPVAVEDLLPGHRLETVDGSYVPLVWKGSITLVPGAPSLSEDPQRLFRVTTDALGPGRPTQDQIFGPAARRLNTDPRVRSTLGADAALVPVAELAEQGAAIAVNPVSPTRVYHLATERHAAILAGGLPVETYHPGPDAVLSMSAEMMEQFMAFFPYLGEIRDFGRLMAPRITAEELLY